MPLRLDEQVKSQRSRGHLIKDDVIRVCIIIQFVVIIPVGRSCIGNCAAMDMVLNNAFSFGDVLDVMQ